MSKAYSNKALPPGTVLREWRLEQVLGVGGFGIVYKGRGIYFDELVAIKEYFPSSISERDEDATVVPIDSDAEEVHALGLKKFVEEAKLLWNLSTPTRHPNIVSVRSLFEIHGTAYMVMDFEDGASLSKLIKSGKRWNEASLTAMIRPIAEGLDRAHRVGVLHRDIKPPNILVNDDGRSVLIDFGSARFESGEATSTKVTFHTPPYAAIEQYVKTYEQGPWTDIYALGVVLYECITGEKPPEVLERMHGDAGKPLAEGNWPGYSKQFLAWVDMAMTIKPTERPQSIPKWLDMLDRGEVEEDDDEDATRIAPMVSSPEEFTPVAPQPEGFGKPGKLATPVPTDPKHAKFKRAGEDTSASRAPEEEPAAKAPEEPKAADPPKAKAPERPPEKAKEAPPEEVKARAPAPEEPKTEVKAPEKPPEKEEPKTEAKAPEKEQAKAAEPPKPEAKAPDTGKAPPAKPGAKPEAKGKDAGKARPGAAKGKKLNPAVVAGAAAAVAVLGGAGWYLSRGGEPAPTEQAAPAEVVAPVDIEASGGIAQAVQSLADDAASARAPSAAVKSISDAAEQLNQLDGKIKAMAADPKQADAARAGQEQMTRLAQKASADFATALIQNADGRVRRLASDLPWADPRNAGAAAGQAPAQQAAARDIRLALAGLRQAATDAGAATDPAAALTAAREALAKSSSYNVAIGRAYRASQAASVAVASAAPATAAASAPLAQASQAPQAPATAGPVGQASQLFPAKYRSFNSIVKQGRDLADDVIRLGRGAKPDDSAPKDVRDGYKIREANVATAKNYLKYLDTLTNSMRGDRSEAEVDKLIASANETKRYLAQLKAGSQAAKH